MLNFFLVGLPSAFFRVLSWYSLPASPLFAEIQFCETDLRHNALPPFLSTGRVGRKCEYVPGHATVSSFPPPLSATFPPLWCCPFLCSWFVALRTIFYFLACPPTGGIPIQPPSLLFLIFPRQAAAEKIVPFSAFMVDFLFYSSFPFRAQTQTPPHEAFVSPQAGPVLPSRISGLSHFSSSKKQSL